MNDILTATTLFRIADFSATIVINIISPMYYLIVARLNYMNVIKIGFVIILLTVFSLNLNPYTFSLCVKKGIYNNRCIVGVLKYLTVAYQMKIKLTYKTQV